MCSSASQANVAWRRRERINTMNTEVMYIPRQLWVGRITELGVNAWAMFTMVLERTYGDCRVSADITIQQFQDQTGLTEKQLQKALDKLYYSGIIRVFGGPNRGTFRFSFEDAVRDGILPAPSPVSVEEV
jgi:hypothetical protein